MGLDSQRVAGRENDGDGSMRVVSVAKVSSYEINLPIGIEEFR